MRTIGTAATFELPALDLSKLAAHSGTGFTSPRPVPVPRAAAPLPVPRAIRTKAVRLRHHAPRRTY